MGHHIDQEWSELTQLTSSDDIPSETSVIPGAPELGKKEAKKIRRRAVKRLVALQEALYAQATDGVLVVLQGLDTAGKDGTIRAVFGGVNPQGVKVHGFKVPTPDEAAHDYLYRIHQAVPARGEIGVFNRSHYEDLIVPLATKKMTEKAFMTRIDEIHEFESYLLEQKITIVKLYLHVSYEEQGRRLLSRLKNPEKHWKFSPNDLTTREHFSSFSEAYRRIIPATSFDELPWHIIPADQRWYRNSVASSIVTEAVAALAPHAPEIDIAHIAKIRDELTTELHDSND
ncbi:PPK2 family polyphosphate kinase [Ferrimicrobium acidiphilum]|uniref:PPK2 family polyphosphate kinase n=1 Tax=Ferrimicrobium acidiphilum TaxID=121039 RepID=UPI0023F20B45|nr:PPK2 family polyphosphate kinase [Ferrimicrobium acidiphilum]